MIRTPILRLAVLASLAALPAPAQDRPAASAPAETTLTARMQAFLAEVERTPNTALAAYFPRRGDWTWEESVRDPRGRRRTGLWRFSGAETLRVITDDGLLCDAFDRRSGVGPHERRFAMQARLHQGQGPWRRVAGNRFVPPGEPATAPVFVEWRREDGQWVVSAFGDKGFYSLRVLGRATGPFSPDTAGIPEDAAFIPADQFTIGIDGRSYSRYGQPRPLNEAERARLVRIGVLNRISVFAERDPAARRGGVVYLLAAPGQYQPYRTHVGVPCR
ncbi:MAG TPA: hypothetical protein VLK84_02380 [Longimicrobium sp.]|nr:hypothetical protein [Longimicrobium sp.]